MQEIRRDPAWRSRAGWLAESTQANLELYNPMVMSKMGMLHDQSIINPFGTDHLVWIDAGIASTCGAYLGDPRWVARLPALLKKFLFLCFPYEGGEEVHGFARDPMASFARTDHVRWVPRGGLFGGDRNAIGGVHRSYYRWLELTLEQGEMGTEESVFSIMASRDPDRYHRFLLPDDGLILHFFDALIRGPVRIVTGETVELSRASEPATRLRPRAFDPSAVNLDQISTALYVVTFNSPAQLRLSLDSWAAHPQFLTRTTRYLIDNSTDPGTLAEYAALCADHGFEHLKQDNLGICGARQFAAQHFGASQHDYMLYFEDDMLAEPADAALCPNGFPAWVEGLYEKLLLIMEKERFDFLKLSFTEAFGNNAQQWAWYNVPAQVRREVWPEMPTLPSQGFAEVVPSTRFEHIGSLNGLAYASGEIYYANWPQIVGREGNRRMFLDSRWAHPYRADLDVAHVSDEPPRRTARRRAVGLADSPSARAPLPAPGAEGVVTPTIFISIAAYREFDLVTTLRDCFAQAEDGSRLRVCICWQHAPGDSLDGFESDSRVTVIDVPHTESRGVCWARHLIQQHYAGETYALQLDGHHRFAPQWDRRMIDMLEQLRQEGVPKPILTGYVPGFDPHNDQARTRAVWSLGIDRFEPAGVVFMRPFVPSPPPTRPVPCRFWSAHFSFTLGSFNRDVVIDPHGYFHAEEIVTCVRAWTHGYDLFTPHETLLWHEYFRRGRVCHWDDHSDWGIRHGKAVDRYRRQFGVDGTALMDCAPYGFGTVRSFRDYERFAGVEFETRGVLRSTLDNAEPPDPLQAAPETEWREHLLTSHCVDIVIDRARLEFDDLHMWSVFANAEDGRELFREDYLHDRFSPILSSQSGHQIGFFISFFSRRQPHTWTVWPHSLQRGWLERTSGDWPRRIPSAPAEAAHVS